MSIAHHLSSSLLRRTLNTIVILVLLTLMLQSCQRRKNTSQIAQVESEADANAIVIVPEDLLRQQTRSHYPIVALRQARLEIQQFESYYSQFRSLSLPFLLLHDGEYQPVYEFTRVLSERLEKVIETDVVNLSTEDETALKAALDQLARVRAPYVNKPFDVYSQLINRSLFQVIKNKVRSRWSSDDRHATLIDDDFRRRLTLTVKHLRAHIHNFSPRSVQLVTTRALVDDALLFYLHVTFANAVHKEILSIPQHGVDATLFYSTLFKLIAAAIWAEKISVNAQLSPQEYEELVERFSTFAQILNLNRSQKIAWIQTTASEGSQNMKAIAAALAPGDSFDDYQISAANGTRSLLCDATIHFLSSRRTVKERMDKHGSTTGNYLDISDRIDDRRIVKTEADNEGLNLLLQTGADRVAMKKLTSIYASIASETKNLTNCIATYTLPEVLYAYMHFGHLSMSDYRALMSYLDLEPENQFADTASNVSNAIDEGFTDLKLIACRLSFIESFLRRISTNVKLPGVIAIEGSTQRQSKEDVSSQQTCTLMAFQKGCHAGATSCKQALEIIEGNSETQRHFYILYWKPDFTSSQSIDAYVIDSDPRYPSPRSWLMQK